MTKREIGFLLIGFGLGLMLALAVLLEVFVSLQRNGTIGSFGLDKIALILPIICLLVGIVLIAYRGKAEPKTV